MNKCTGSAVQSLVRTLASIIPWISCRKSVYKDQTVPSVIGPEYSPSNRWTIKWKKRVSNDRRKESTKIWQYRPVSDSYSPLTWWHHPKPVWTHTHPAIPSKTGMVSRPHLWSKWSNDLTLGGTPSLQQCDKDTKSPYKNSRTVHVYAKYGNK